MKNKMYVRDTETIGMQTIFYFDSLNIIHSGIKRNWQIHLDSVVLNNIELKIGNASSTNPNLQMWGAPLVTI